MRSSYRNVAVTSQGLHLRVSLVLKNDTGVAWDREQFFIGWQFFDPESERFIREGIWTPISQNTSPGQSIPVEVEFDFPPEPGGYRIYVSPIEKDRGWAYRRGETFLIVDVTVSDEQVRVDRTELTSLRSLRWRAIRRAIPKAFQYPFQTIARNHRLIRSMARRDILARYRGSFGDVVWTVLNPLLLMSTYFFVFGVVLHTRFGPDQSSTGFALYFLAGMLPWLAFSEPAGRSPHVVLEHRNFVKKLIFPLETLPVNQVVSGFITELFALGVFLLALLVIRGSIPLTVVWLPVLIIPQLLFTLGVCWFLAALGAYLRDLGQIIGFVLTLWFFVTPICYPETNLPAASLVILGKNPMYVLVRGYRAIFLENHAPPAAATMKLWLVAMVVFLVGHGCFFKLRKTFADVI